MLWPGASVAYCAAACKPSPCRDGRLPLMLGRDHVLNREQTASQAIVGMQASACALLPVLCSCVPHPGEGAGQQPSPCLALTAVLLRCPTVAAELASSAQAQTCRLLAQCLRLLGGGSRGRGASQALHLCLALAQGSNSAQLLVEQGLLPCVLAAIPSILDGAPTPSFVLSRLRLRSHPATAPRGGCP